MSLKISAMVLMSLLLVACGKSNAPTDAGGSAEHGDATASAESNEGSGAAAEGDPCSLLTAAEVEKAIGPLAGPPYLTGADGPDKHGSKCTYEAKDLRSVTVNPAWSDGASIMKMLGMPGAAADQAGMKGKLPLPDGVTMSGEWDEAKAMSCCEITALRGDQVVAIDFMNTKLTTEQGVELLNAALLRLEKPLKDVKGSAGVDAAAARVASGEGRPKPVPACQLVTAEDATAVLGAPVEVLPQDNDRHCGYRSKAKPQMVDFAVEWSGGYRQLRSDAELGGKVVKGLMGDLAKDAPEAKATEYPGPWEQAQVVVMSFVAVKQDVMMSADIRGAGLEKAQAVVKGAMEKLNLK